MNGNRSSCVKVQKHSVQKLRKIVLASLVAVKDHLLISLLILSEFERIN